MFTTLNGPAGSHRCQNQILIENRDFCRAMLCISAAYAVVRCMSVRLSGWVSVTFLYTVETSKLRVFKNFSPSCIHTIIVFFHSERFDNIPTGSPLTGGGVECRWGRQKYRQISGFFIDYCWTVACCQHFDSGVYVVELMRRPSRVINKRRHATHQLIFLKHNQNYYLKT